MTRYSESETEIYYDEQDALYKQCWAADGTTHWGFFENEEVDDLQEAGWLWTQKILEKSEITPDSRVLEIGCGNGAVTIWLAQQTGCSVTGIDLSSVRIDNAKKIAAAHSDLNVQFVCGTITDLPFEDGEFTHVWGQGVLYHIPDLDMALSEVARVLAHRGILLIDDFVRPDIPVSEPVREHFYDRLKFEAKYTHQAYLDAMKTLNLMPIETINMAEHIARTYVFVSSAAESIDKDVAESFRISGDATRRGEVVGYFYKYMKITDPAQWVYESRSSEDVETRYDIWAQHYDSDITSDYDTPTRAARQFSQYVTNKDTPVLDAGCGTGLVGQALASAGYRAIHGLDISRGMLEIAEQKGCYSRLFRHDMSADADVEPYAAIISAGCITFGHAPGYALARLFSWLTPGGVFHVTVRRDFMEQDLYFKTLIHGLRWDLLDEQSWSIKHGEQVMGLVLKKHASG